jgi:hypothetical protein
MEPTTEIPHIGFVFSLNPTVRTRKRRIVMQRRSSQPHSFETQIAAEKVRLQEQLTVTAHGPQRDALVKKIRQLDTASHMSDWLRSPGLRSPE